MSFTRAQWKRLTPAARARYRQLKHERRTAERDKARVAARRRHAKAKRERPQMVQKQNRPPCVGDCPGDELKGLLRRIGFKPEGANCECERHAREMNRKGSKWCEKNVGMIVGWLKVEADRRGGMPKRLFVWSAVEGLVWLAIRRARRRAEMVKTE